MTRPGSSSGDEAEQYRLLFAHNPHPMWTYDVETLQFLAANNAATRHYGYSESEFLAMTLRDIVPAEDLLLLAERLKGIKNAGKRTRLGRHRLKNGAIIDVEISSDSVTFSGRAARLVLAHDVTTRLVGERRLAEQAALLDHATDAIMVRDLDHTIRYWNRSAERVFGWSRDEALNQNARMLLAGEPAHYDAATQALLEHGEWIGELEKQGRDRKVTVASRWTLVRDVEGRPTSVLVIDTDITGQRRLQEQSLRAQRLESVGTMAGGIAHDLNNILAPIMMSIESLREIVKDDDAVPLLEILNESAHRGADLVRQVLSFARGVDGDRVPVNLAALVKELLKVLRETFPKSIEIRLEVPEQLWYVSGDPTQLNQVFMNLCVNARDAMPEGGRLTIGLENVVLDETYAAMNVDARQGAYLKVKVVDTGTGISRAIRDRMFEPFFTTKDVGKGTGLGLSTTMAIVRSHRGFINVYSETGLGTKFHLYLPAEVAEPDTIQVESEQRRLPMGHGELVLVVDDEAAIREVARRTLERFGYRVILASNGAEAVAVYARQSQEIAVILTDMAMPIMDGPALIVALRSIRADVKIIGSSGMASNGGIARALGAGVEEFVHKPYTAEAILTTIARVLRGPVADASDEPS